MTRTRRFPSFPLLLLVFLTLVGGCTPTTEPDATLILQVGPHRAECMTMMPTTCLQVREGTTGPFLNFSSEIEGFTWEEGFTYTLLVRRSVVPNPPADGSSYRWVLLEVLERTPA